MTNTNTNTNPTNRTGQRSIAIGGKTFTASKLRKLAGNGDTSEIILDNGVVCGICIHPQGVEVLSWGGRSRNGAFLFD